MTDRPFLSIIIPCYNQERWIRRCLESVEAQDTTLLECIVVDDGSTDRSLEIINRFKYDAGGNDRCSWLTVVSQENNGVSVARNSALALARGMYFTGLDADDRLAEEAVSVFFRAVTEYDEPDILIGSILREKEDGVTYHCPSGSYEYPGYDMVCECIIGRINLQHWGTPWGKVIKIDSLDKHSLRYLPGMVKGQDMHLMLRLMPTVGRVVVIPDPVYVYNVQNESTSAKFRGDAELEAFRNLITQFKATGDNCPEKYADEMRNEMIPRCLANMMMQELSVLYSARGKHRYHYLRKLNYINKEVLPDWLKLQGNRKARIVARMMRIGLFPAHMMLSFVALFPTFRRKMRT